MVQCWGVRHRDEIRTPTVHPNGQHLAPLDGRWRQASVVCIRIHTQAVCSVIRCNKAPFGLLITIWGAPHHRQKNTAKHPVSCDLQNSITLDDCCSSRVQPPNYTSQNPAILDTLNRTMGWGLRIVVAAVALGCSTPSDQKPDVLLITWDAVRADHVGQPWTPTWNELSEQSAVFTNARTPAPITLPAHASPGERSAENVAPARPL
jgi:hypothetical protein